LIDDAPKEGGRNILSVQTHTHRYVKVSDGTSQTLQEKLFRQLI